MLRRWGFILVLCTLSAVVSAAAGSARNQVKVQHSCGTTDMAFLQTATVDVNAFPLGTTSADDALAAAQRLHATEPVDPTLRQARSLFGAMYSEYGAGIQAREASQPSGQFLKRAAKFGKLARKVLGESRGALQPLGCDVAPLL
jgi:hypothetical protein